MESIEKDKLKNQLYALRDIVINDYESRGNCHWQVGEALNLLRDEIIQILPDQEKQTLGKLIYPLEVNRPQSPFNGPYLVSSSDAFRLVNQLSAIFKDKSQTPTQVVENSSDIERVIPKSKKIFLIHGHDTTNTQRLRSLLKEKYGLEPIILSEKPGKGRTLIEKFEDEGANAAFAIALITPDDFVHIQNQEYAQARPNVVFEIGWFYGRLGRERVCILLKEGAAIHSDLEGILRIQFSISVEEKILEIENELKAAGLL